MPQLFEIRRHVASQPYQAAKVASGFLEKGPHPFWFAYEPQRVPQRLTITQHSVGVTTVGLVGGINIASRSLNQPPLGGRLVGRLMPSKVGSPC